jgi:hypothetical protein
MEQTPQPVQVCLIMKDSPDGESFIDYFTWVVPRTGEYIQISRGYFDPAVYREDVIAAIDRCKDRMFRVDAVRHDMRIRPEKLPSHSVQIVVHEVMPE